MATGVALDLPAQAIEAGLAGVASVPGRFQIVSSPGDDVTVIVDYAHTDDALKNLLEAVRPIAAARLTTVFGCGGDRDRSKRPLMGAVAARLSDTVGLTSDNPRSEDPERIIDEIELGFAPPQDRGRPDGGAASTTGIGLRWWRLADRRAAIDRAVTEAGPGDIVVIAGKGHEKYQVIRERVLPFDDVIEAQRRARTAAHAEGVVSAAAVPLTAARAAAAMAGSLTAGPADAVIGGVSIDTRTLRAGDVYIAIIGERLDGHRFVGEALRAGAAGVVVSDPSSVPPGARSGASWPCRSTTRRGPCSGWRGTSGARPARRWWRSPAAPGRPRRRKSRPTCSGRDTACSAPRATSTTTSGCRCRCSSSATGPRLRSSSWA